MVKNLPADVGDTGSIPSPRTKILHAMGQLRLGTTMTEPAVVTTEALTVML